ncbi:hypothetical protein ACGFIW_01555 [Micromonospora sp. NPDC048935]|uniref:hypothetical protein n=1 Tax=Micromonospora sp. NPDC048935 TaxID=3364262 RepID=UPI003718BFD1
MTDPVTRIEQVRHPAVTPTPVTAPVTLVAASASAVTGDAPVTVTEGAALLHDLTHLPADIHRNALAYLRGLWPEYPKTMPNLITEPEEDPDER